MHKALKTATDDVGVSVLATANALGKLGEALDEMTKAFEQSQLAYAKVIEALGVFTVTIESYRATTHALAAAIDEARLAE